MWQRLKNFLFENTTTRQTVAKNAFWLLFGQLSGRLLKALIVIYAARALGADQYGVFTYAISFVALFSVLGDLGVMQIVMREIAKKKESLEEIVASGLALKLAASTIDYALIILLAFILTPIPGSEWVVIFMAIAFLFDAFREYGNAIVRALEKMQVDAGVTIINQSVTVVLGLLALIIWKTPLALAIAYAIGSSIGFFTISFYLRDILPRIKNSFDKRVMLNILRDSWPFAFLSITAIILTNTDSVMLGWLVSTEQVGYYGAALKPIQILFVLPGMISVALFPTLSRKHASPDISLIERAIGAVILLALPITVGGMLIPDFVIHVLYGKAYFPSIHAFSILLFIVLLNFPATIMGYTVLAHNKQIKTIKYFVLAALVNIVCNFFFITKWGIAGAAAATTLSQIIATGGYYLVLRSFVKLSVFRYVWKPLVATSLMGIGIYSLRILSVELPIIFIGSVLFYPITLYVLKDPILQEVKTSLATLRS